MEDGDRGCPFEVGIPLVDGDSTPPFDDGTLLLLTGAVGVPAMVGAEGAKLLLELMEPLGSLPFVVGAGSGTGETPCGDVTVGGVTTPGVGGTIPGVGTDGAVGPD